MVENIRVSYEMKYIVLRIMNGQLVLIPRKFFNSFERHPVAGEKKMLVAIVCHLLNMDPKISINALSMLNTGFLQVSGKSLGIFKGHASMPSSDYHLVYPLNRACGG